MCGIAGILGKNVAASRLEVMERALAHRGPDGAGILVWPEGGLAHRRLSIIDLSDAGRQPMCSASGRYALVFNGEIYNYKELRGELSGYPFQSHTDTEVILAAWEHWGEACLERFLGMFAFALMDRETGQTTLVRDRLGIKPLFYSVQQGELLFASEIKALLAAGVPFEANEHMLAHYLIHGYYDHTPETFYAGIRSLPAGHVLHWSAEREELKRWWLLPSRVQSMARLDEATVKEGFRSLLEDSLRMHLRSDVPVGVNLSSGIDSLSLFYGLQRTTDVKQLHVFSMGFAEPAWDETEDIAALVQAESVPFHRVEIGPSDYETWWKKMVETMDQPFGGLSTIGYAKLMSEPRQYKVKVVLEGQGVDEMLAGYRYYLGPYYRDLVRQGRWREMLEQVSVQQSSPGFRNWLAAVRSCWRLQRRASGGMFQDGTSFLRLSCLDPAWVNHMREVEPPQFEAPFKSVLLNALYRDTCYTKLPRVLRFNDHVSMAFGLELRVPYLDHRLVEYAFCLPDAWKIRKDMTKVLLREIVKDVVPEHLRVRQKRPQSSPQTVWFKTALQETVRQQLRSDEVRALPFVNQTELLRTFEQFTRDPQDKNSVFFWQIINLAYWYARRSYVQAH